MIISLDSKPIKVAEFLGKDNQTGDFLVKNSQGIVVKVCPQVYNFLEKFDGKKTVSELKTEFENYIGLHGDDAEKAFQELLRIFIIFSLIKIEGGGLDVSKEPEKN